MIARRPVLLGLGAGVVAGAAWTAGAYRAAMADAGAPEYAIAGHGPPLLMLHGTGGGFDQGLLFAHRLRESGFGIVAPSRFGYLRSAFPDDPSPAHQADALVALLDALGMSRLAVIGGSAGALTAAQFALRHPDR